MLAELPSDMNRTAKVPAAVQLFNVNPDAKKFPKEKVLLFHQLLYLCRNTRQDIQTAVALSTGVKEFDEELYKKLS